MANVDSPFGFRVANSDTGWNGTLTEMVVASGTGNVFVGDLVIPDGTGDTDGRMGVTPAIATSANIVGVIVGFKATGPDALTGYRGATGAVRYPFVVRAIPGMEFIVQADDALAITDLGNGYDIVVAAGNTTTGASGMELDVATRATTGATLRLVGIERAPDNELDTAAAGTNCRVTISEGFLHTGGAGV